MRPQLRKLPYLEEENEKLSWGAEFGQIYMRQQKFYICLFVLPGHVIEEERKR